MKSEIVRGVTVDYNEGGERVTLRRVCPFCHRLVTAGASVKDIKKIKRGASMMELLHLPASTREMFITGMCDPCWDAMCPEEED